MSIGTGSRLGLYEVVAALGAGGMGEVFRARDTRLGRDVALKVLPQSFAADQDRLARFEREALMLAALNHPNISALYGIEESTGVRALILELVDGTTVAERIEHGPIAADEALAIARQVCDALAAAHEHGIIHRDLKPANVKLRPDGVVKVLDFGLAKLTEARRSALETVAAPVVTRTTAALTGVGVILGTAAYMSPEQAKGEEADKRSDVWAFGCLLYEMLTAKRPFAGGTITEVLAAVLHAEPDWSAIPPATPPLVARLLRRCLQKDPRKRLHDLADARLDLDEAIASPHVGVLATSPAPARGASVARWWIAIVATALLAAAGTWALASRPRPASDTPLHLMVALPPAITIGFSRGSAVAISPDAHLLAYTAGVGGLTRLYTRAVDRSHAVALEGTEGAANPFFSPDGQWIGFFADGKLKKVRVGGGGAAVVTDAPNPRGEAWGPDDHIYFTPKNNSSIWRAPANGGQAQQVTKLLKGEFSHRWPQILPGGKAILFTVWNDTGFEGGRVAVQRLDSAEHQVLLPGGGYPRVVGPDARGRSYLVYAQADGVMAVPFDLDRLALAGEPVRVLDDVITNLSGGAHMSIAANGMLAYLPGTLAIDRDLVWVERAGHPQPARSVRAMSINFALSNDGRRVARQNVVGAMRDLWIEELDRGTSTRFTFDSYTFGARWSPDGQWLAYGKDQPVLNLFRKRADGTGQEERLTTSANAQAPSSWSADGRTLVFVENDPVTGADLWTLALDGDRKPMPLVQTPFTENNAAVSPDGKWVVYQSNESGRFEIYALPFPGGGRKYQLSTDGGFLPAWAHSGKEVFYQTARGMMAVAIATQPEFNAGRPTLLFEGQFQGDTNISPDDRRFLLLKGLSQETSATQIYVVTHWFDELARLFPPR